MCGESVFLCVWFVGVFVCLWVWVYELECVSLCLCVGGSLCVCVRLSVCDGSVCDCICVECCSMFLSVSKYISGKMSTDKISLGKCPMENCRLGICHGFKKFIGLHLHTDVKQQLIHWQPTKETSSFPYSNFMA